MAARVLRVIDNSIIAAAGDADNYAREMIDGPGYGCLWVGLNFEWKCAAILWHFGSN